MIQLEVWQVGECIT